VGPPNINARARARREWAMMDFIVNVTAVVVGIAVYKKIIIWSSDFKRYWRNRFEKDPWDDF
tara:strand:+ start:249 stop:434 length:186 start_codon:yes stop_codon:yes gene_type:complete